MLAFSSLTNRALSIAAAVLILAASPAQASEKLYKWVDENGVTHYGDRVPPEYARNERYVLNERAVQVRTLPAQKTEAQLAEEARQAQLAEMAQMEEVRKREADRILLDTYLSVDEIEMLRDRRVSAIDAQIGVTEHYLKNLRTKWGELERDAARYNYPYREDSELPPLPEDLNRHLDFTRTAMDEHMQTLRALRAEQESIRSEFASNIDRFRELKSLR